MTSASSTKREQCIFSCKDRMCVNMDKAGIPADPKWRTMILFTRSMKNHYFLSPSQKKKLQSALVSIVQKKDFSENTFKSIVDTNQAILNEPYIEKLEETIEASEALLQECKELLQKRKGDIQQIETTSVRSVLSARDPKELIKELKTAFRTVITSMEKDVSDLDQLSRTDGLTGLPNRRTFDDFLSEQTAQCFAGGASLSLLMLDVDHFKKFNDQYGHRIGDQALGSVAKVLRESMLEFEETKGKKCLVSRYGGEEFGVVMPLVGAEEALQQAEIIRQQIANYNFIIRDANGRIKEKDIKITASIGVAEARYHENCNLKNNIRHLVDSADKGLYEAKDRGRNTSCLFQDAFAMA